MNLQRLQQLAGMTVTPAQTLTESASAVSQINGFKVGDRVVVTDVASKPPATYKGEIKNLFSDGYAHITFDQSLTPQAKQSMEDNGRINLHNVRKESVKESKTLNEAGKEVSTKVLVQTSGPGLSGDMVNIPSGPVAEALAKMFGVKDDPKTYTKVGKVFATYDKDFQLVFFTNESDFDDMSEED